MPVEVVFTPYGRPALSALRTAVADAKGGDALAPVTVVVPSNHVGVTARRLLAGGALGEVVTRGSGVAAVTFLTTYRLSELLGAAALASTARRPVSTPVIAAGVRRSLGDAPGVFAPVASHPATERALVATYAELSDVSPAGLRALAGAGPRAHDVVDICGRARDLLSAGWYDESDLTGAATAHVAGAPTADLERDIGQVVVHLPQDLLRRQADLLAALASRLPTRVIVGLTGRDDADAGVIRSLDRLGLPVPSPVEVARVAARAVPVAPDTTHIVTASDADDEVRAAVRRVLEAVRSGTPLERIAVLFGTPHPYGRLVHEHLAAAGVPRNGAAVRPLVASTLGRTIADVLALAEHDYRRADVLGLLARAAGGSAAVPTAAWERLSRQAGVVAGRSDWDLLLGAAARQHDHDADDLDGGDERDGPRARRQRLQAERTRALRTRVLRLIDTIAEAQAHPAPWAARVPWLRALLADLVGPGGRDEWPPDELLAADKIESALERLVALDTVDRPPTLEVFRRTLEIELEADLGRVGRLGHGVLVGPLSFAVGLDLDLVVVLGMAEGTLPAPVRDDALLPDADRDRTGGELELRRGRVGRDHRRVRAALAAAPRHLLCLPRGDLRASSARVPSRWLVDVASVLAGDRVASDAVVGRPDAWVEDIPSFAHAVQHCAFPATEQEYRLRVGAARAADGRTSRGAAALRARQGAAFTRFDGNLSGVEVPSPVDGVVSSTRLEGWARCPFAYFGQRLLGVEPVDDPAQQLEMTAMTRGSLIHEVLERFVTDVLARPSDHQPGPDTPWSDDDHALIRRLAHQVCDDYEHRGLTGRPVFWRRDRAQILALARRFLLDDDRQRQAARSRPVAAEFAFGVGDVPAVELPLADGRGLRFRGSADRIDAVDGGGLLVLDYKTGKKDDFSKLSADDPDLQGTKLQLVVYALAARAMAGRPDTPVESQYWFVSERGGFGRKGYPVDDDIVARVTATIGTIVTGIEAGVFPARPVDGYTPWVTCPYCDPDGLGVADLRRDWERKRDDPLVAPYAAMAEPVDEAVVQAVVEAADA